MNARLNYCEVFERIHTSMGMDERPVTLDLNQVADEATTYERYRSAARAMLTTYLAARNHAVKRRRLERTIENDKAPEDKVAIARIYLPEAVLAQHRLLRRFARLFAAAIYLLDQLPDITDPHVRYELELESKEANAYNRLMADLHTTGIPSLAFWDLYGRIVRKETRERLYEIARPPRREGEHEWVANRRQAMIEWARNDDKAKLGRELAELPPLDLDEAAAIVSEGKLPALPCALELTC